MGNDYVSRKQRKEYKLWARPTITWALECEAPKPRAQALEYMIGANESAKGVDRSNKAIRAIAITLCVFVPISSCVLCGLATDGKGAVFAIGFCCVFFIQTSFLITMWLLANHGNNLLDIKLKSMERLTIVNGCSDEYTNVPIASISGDFAAGKQKQSTLVGMAIAMTVMMGVVLLCMCGGAIVKAQKD